MAQTTLHNLGNILNTLYALLDDMQNQLKPHQVCMLHQVFRYLTQTIRTSQKFFALHPPSPEIFSLSTTVLDTFYFFDQELQQQQIAIQHDIPPKVLIRGQRNILQQILINLLRNSIQALQNTPPGKKFLSCTVQVSAAPQPITLSFVDSAGGVSPQYLDCLSQPGFSTKDWGLGLGLAYVRWHMLHTFRGQVEFANVPHQGFMVRLHFPPLPEIATIAPCDPPHSTIGKKSRAGSTHHSSAFSV